MSYFLEFHPEAAAELECITGDYEARLKGLGVRFRKVVEKACGRIEGNPYLWRERPSGQRRVNIAGFPYYISFIIDKDRILIVAVPHTSRRPDYWKNRLP